MGDPHGRMTQDPKSSFAGVSGSSRQHFSSTSGGIACAAPRPPPNRGLSSPVSGASGINGDEESVCSTLLIPVVLGLVLVSAVQGPLADGIEPQLSTGGLVRTHVVPSSSPVP